MRRPFLLFSVFLWPMLAFISPAMGQSATPKVNPLALAAVLVENGEAANACALLDVVFGTETRNSRALYLFGECHMAQGLIQDSARFYERALQEEPQAVLIRAKLAGVYLRLDRDTDARSLLAQAARVNPESEAAERLTSLTRGPVQAGIVKTTPPQNWTAEVSLMRLYDSNANGGSIASTVDAIIGGLPLRLDIAPTSRAAPAWGTAVSAHGSFMHPLDGYYALILRGDASATIYEEAQQYSRQSVSAGAGIVYRNGALTWSAVPNVRFSWEGGRPEETQLAIDGRLNYQLDQNLSITAAGQVGYSIVPFNRSRDAWTGVAAAGIHYVFDPRIRGGVQLIAQRSAGQVATEAYTGIGPEIYLSADLTDTLTLDASYAYMRVHFDQTLGMFPQGRQDNRQSMGIALNLDLSEWQEGLSASAKYNYLRTDSSISLYTSDRHLISAGLQYRF